MAHDEMVFEVGASVEVSPDDIGLSGSWYEATILHKVVPETPKTKTKSKSKSSSKKKNPNMEMYNCYYLVEYKTLLDDEDETKLLKERVRAANVRPHPPPPPPEHEFKLNDIVEAFHRDGWWVGVITELLQDSGNFRVTFSYPPDQIQCPASDLRIHLEWNDGVWVQPQAHATNQLEIEVKSLKKKRARSHQELAGDDASKNGSRRVIQTPPSRKSKALESCYQTRTRSSKKQKTVSQDSVNVKGDKDSSKDVPNNKIGVCMVDKDHIKSTSDTQPQTLKTHSTPCVDDSGKSPNPNVQGNGISLVKSNQESKIVEKAAVIDFYGYKFRNLGEELGVVNEATPDERNGSNVINPMQEMGIIEQPAAVEENENNLVNPSQETEVVEQSAAAEGNIREVVNSNQELEIIGGHTSAIVGRNVADRKDLKFPFEKTLALWNIIESMPVFQATQQKPHFRSLVDKYPVHCREGKAIGYMLMFRDVVQKTAKSTLDDDRESIFEILGTLPKLERNGFEVKEIRNHLTTLLERKDEYNHIKDQLMEQNQKKEKVVDVIEELNKQIKERQEKCAEAISTKENVECEIGRFKSDLEALRESFAEDVFDFECEAGALS